MILSILFSIVPVLLLLYLIYSIEDVKKQPIWLLLVLFGFGILSWLLVRYISNLFGNDIYKSQIEVSVFLGNIGFFLISFSLIALIEELSKFVILNIVTIGNKFFKNPYDGIMYAVCISLGFAFIENIMYINDYGIGVALSRAIFSIPVHAVFGIIMGYFLGIGWISKGKKMTSDVIKMYYLAFFVPFIFHGLYDYVCNINIPYQTIIFLVMVLTYYALSVFFMIRLHRIDMRNEKKYSIDDSGERIYNPEKKNYKNIYYYLNNQLEKSVSADSDNSNLQQSNWKHTENDDVVYENKAVEMNMFKNNDDN